MKPTIFTQKFFLGAAGAVLLLNLYLGIDFLSIWQGAEAEIGLGLRSIQDLPAGLHAWFQQLLWRNGAEDVFWYRLAGGLLLLGSAGLMYFWGRPLLGQRGMLFALWVLGSSLLWVQAGRFASGDAWLVAAQVAGSFAWLRYLKQPTRLWQFASWISFLFGIFISPLQMLIWSAVLFVSFWFFHPQGKRLKSLHIWVGWIIGIALFVWSNQQGWNWSDGFYAYYGKGVTGWYLLLTVLGMLPWVGFLLAGFRESWTKLRQREELALVHISLLVAGLLSFSLLPQVALALMISRQLINYELPNYPFRNWVRMPAILHLLLVFCFGTVGMVYGFLELGAAGFRLLMVLSLPYWVGSFISLIGLYGLMSRYYLGGIAASGILLTLIFWVQVAPVLEAHRNLPKRAAELGASMQATGGEDLIMLPAELEPVSTFLLYAHDQNLDLRFHKSRTAAIPGVWLLPEASFDSLPGAVHMQGAWQGIETSGLWLWKNSGTESE